MQTKRSIIKRYLLFLLLGPTANVLWALWVLPQINERGTGPEMLQWFLVQSFYPVIFGVLLAFRKKLVFWLLIIYSGFMTLFTIGMLGWALMSPEAPISIYVVCLLLVIMSFGLLFNSLKDLKLDRGVQRYETQD